MDMSQPHNVWGVIIALIMLANTVFQIWGAFQVKKIELATNSMKDALVLATKKEALLTGANEERERAAIEHATNVAGTTAAVSAAVSAAVAATEVNKKLEEKKQ